VKIPNCVLYHYDVSIVPDKCPRRVNREIVEALVQAQAEYFAHQKPVFDGRKNLYSRKPLPIGRDRVEVNVTLPGGDGKERTFTVGIKHVAQVNLELLERVLRGEQLGMPFESIQALDVVVRHLPSMR